MTHLATGRTRAENTPRAWLQHGRQIAKFVNSRSLHDDIVCFLGTGAGQGYAACYSPSTAEIELDIKIAFAENVEPDWVGDFRERRTLFDWPKAAGAVIHEASHARWTVWPLERLEALRRSGQGKLAEVIERFEESRIEHLAVVTWPEDKGFLRSSAMEIVMEGIDLDELKNGSLYQTSMLALLTTARRDAGVLDDEDVEALENVMLELFGEDLYAGLRAIWQRMHDIDPRWDTDRIWTHMLELAQEWLKLLPEEPETPEERAMSIMAAIGDMIADAQESAEVGGNEDAGDQENKERVQAQMAQDAEARNEAKEHKATAESVFGKGTAEIPSGATYSRVINKRPPKDTERAAAVILAQQLEKARYRDRTVTEVRSQLPPGRLHTGTAVQGVAQQQRGQMVTVEPWQRSLRRHTEDPELQIGVMVDISSSMSGAMEAMSVTAWVLAEAGYRIQARVAQVYYGNSVFPTLKPGTRMPEVVIRSASDGTEKFNTAFMALDGELELLNGSGARLLVICSDTCYTGTEAPHLKRWVKRAVDAGVGVLILTYDGYGADVRGHHLPSQVQVIVDPMGPVDSAKAIGQAAVKALAAVSPS